ncbi:MAG: hypothetical protein KJ000_24095 [Pirellulaceae bacterium]|nr:hypothetical protein [Pirellulaceae bacterium]
MTWNELIILVDAEGLIRELGLDWLLDGGGSPGDKDRALAWDVLVELRTRISTQPLHFLDGDEATALDSLYRLFQIVRDVLKKHGADAQQTAAVVVAVLNQVIRPFTAQWHRRKVAGDLARDDACREFRGELRKVQQKLVLAERLLEAVACGGAVTARTQPTSPGTRVESGDSIAFDRLLGLPSVPASGDDAEQILQRERVEIEDRRAAVGQTRGSDDLVGLAVSGGGIRSATFALGVIQGLAARGMLRQLDYLSTVSGGGYVGAWLSSLLNTDSPDCGPQPDRAPFKTDVAGDSAAIRHLRNHSRYILPASFSGWLGTVGQAAYGIASNLIVLSTLVFVAVLATGAVLQSRLADLHQAVEGGQSAEPTIWDLSWWTQLLWAASLALLFLVPLLQRLGRLGGAWSAAASAWQWLTVGGFAVSLLATALDSVPLAHYGYYAAVHFASDSLYTATKGWSLAATGVALVNAAGFLAARSRWVARLVSTRPRLGKLLFSLLWLAGPALVVFAYFELCRVYVADPPQYVARFDASLVGVKGWTFELTATGLLWLLLVGSSLYALLTNVNFTSLHRYYRNRLAETYLLRRQPDGTVRSTEHPPRCQQRLSQMRQQPGSTAPYHLINAALNLPSSKIAELRGRDRDFYLFSKHYCGSPVLGYHPTLQWEAADLHLDLGTAVAISGAAAAPQMGMASIRNASFLLALLNVRLGYWLHRPIPPRWQNRWLQALSAPGPDYLLREALNQMDQRSRYVNVSDGGHLENLGLYELLRRRCRYIIAIDGECDPEIVFPGLIRLQQFAWVDLGVRIVMDLGRLRWTQSAAQSDDDHGASATGRPAFSRGHFGVGRIEYPDGATGLLIYIKLTVTGNEPDYVLDYRRRHPEFPHQSTADQVFDEEQFEAYRCLGEHITADLFSPEVLSDLARQHAEQCQLSLADWYQEIADCFLPRSRISRGAAG